MGKAVKSVIGVGLALAGAGVFGVLGTAFTLGGVAISYGSIASLVGLSLLGSALAPDIGDMFGADSYSGQKLQTRKDNTSAVPVVYGLNKLAGNIIWQTTNAEINTNSSTNGYNRDYWAIYALAGHNIEDITKVYANTLALTDKGSDKFTSEYTHIKWYDSSVTDTDLNDIIFVTNADGSSQTFGSMLGGIAESDLTLSYSNTSTNRGLLLNGSIGTGVNKGWEVPWANNWIQFDLGSLSNLYSVGFKFVQTNSLNDDIVYDIKLQYQDGANWVDTGDSISGTIYQEEDDTYSEIPTYTINNTHATARQTWRVFITTLENHGGVGVVGELFINSNTVVDVDIPKDTAYLAVHQVFDGQDNKNTELDNILVEMKGKKIRSISSSGFGAVAYSNNPAEIIADLLTDGLSIADADIDISSFNQARQSCSSNSWSANVAFIQQANIQSVINDILSTCRAQIIHSGGKWKLKIDTKSQTSVATITDNDIINQSLSISMAGNQEIANKITVKYINPADEWLSAQAFKQDADLVSWDDQIIEKALDIKSITNTNQASQLAEITLNSMRYSEDASGNRIKQTPLRLSFSTTVKNAHLEVGDVISVDHDVLDRVRKFVILSTETDQSGLIQVSTREYAETHYKDSTGNYLI